MTALPLLEGVDLNYCYPPPLLMTGADTGDGGTQLLVLVQLGGGFSLPLLYVCDSSIAMLCHVVV